MKIINLHQEENEIIRLAVDNNRQAQQKIYAKFSPKMLSVCRQYVKDIQQAEDVMITSFMKVFVNLKHFENKGSFEGWIRRIMVNECISFIRAKKEFLFIEEETFFEDSLDDMECQFALDDIQLLIDNLPDGYKAIFNLYVVEGYKHKEIAVLLSISEGTSKSQLSHAKKMLQNQIVKLKEYQYAKE